ncbi:MAG TPA: hypothetical protein VFB54_03655 [Burkholderiales bacterium]|nr:hypothetical protein [Burkholderiales bacterium]
MRKSLIYAITLLVVAVGVMTSCNAPHAQALDTAPIIAPLGLCEGTYDLAPREMRVFRCAYASSVPLDFSDVVLATASSGSEVVQATQVYNGVFGLPPAGSAYVDIALRNASNRYVTGLLVVSAAIVKSETIVPAAATAGTE